MGARNRSHFHTGAHFTSPNSERREINTERLAIELLKEAWITPLETRYNIVEVKLE